MKVKNIKKDKGFSLVELIIAVVILGIVSIVAIGGLYSWVTKSRQNTDIANCGTIKEALWASVPSAKFPSLGYKYCWFADVEKHNDGIENTFGCSVVYSYNGNSLTSGGNVSKNKFQDWFVKSLGNKSYGPGYSSLIDSKTGNTYAFLVYVNETGAIYDIKVILIDDFTNDVGTIKNIMSYYDSDFSGTPSNSKIVYDGISKFFD